MVLGLGIRWHQGVLYGVASRLQRLGFLAWGLLGLVVHGAARQGQSADGDDDRPNCWLCEEMTGTTAVASAKWSIARMTWDKLESKQAHGKPHCPVPKGQTWQAPKV
eukprot:COSAG01_NODE_37889_length_497_cov_1.527638_1_plen_107_part_00